MTRVQRALLAGAALVAVSLLAPLAILVRDQWPPLRRADVRLSQQLVVAEGAFRDLLLALTQLGAPLILEAAALVWLLVLVRRKQTRLAGYVGASVFGAEAVSFATKLVVERVRPCAGSASCPVTTSFPSGHAVGSAAFWTAVAVLLLPRIGPKAWALLAVPLLVALTRVLLGVHYPSDVVGGLLMGGCWVAATTAVFSAWRAQDLGHDVPLEEGLDEPAPAG